jgi:low temperature requirement protein LtrA
VTRTMPGTVIARFGLRPSLLTAVCAGAYLVAKNAVASPAWHGMADYVAAFDTSQMLWLIPALVLAPSFVVLMACVSADVREDRKLFAQLGLAFAIIYAAQITTNYGIQLIAIRPALTTGDAATLAVFATPNPNGIFFALESLGYLFQELGMLFVAFVFVGGRLERSIRWSFLFNAIGATALTPINGGARGQPLGGAPRHVRCPAHDPLPQGVTCPRCGASSAS